MLRCYNYNLLNDLKKSFILVLDSGYFPKSWNRRIICTFYKYMTLPIIVRLHWPAVWENSLALTYLLGLRMKQKRKNYSPNPKQISEKNYRTTDHIMTLFTLIKKSLRQGKCLYTCFVDFRKAYDSICRQRLT